MLLLSPGLLAVHVRPKQLHTASDGRNMFNDVTGRRVFSMAKGVIQNVT